MSQSPTIRVTYLDGADPTVALPAYQTPEAAGADIRANLPEDQREHGITLPPFGRALIPTGLAMEIPKGWEVQFRPRSGLALKHGISLVNSPATIDSDYRGPLGLIVINMGQEPFTIEHGARMAQMVVAPAPQAEFDLVPSLDTDTPRGAGGFGSTGMGL